MLEEQEEGGGRSMMFSNSTSLYCYCLHCPPKQPLNALKVELNLFVLSLSAYVPTPPTSCKDNMCLVDR